MRRTFIVLAIVATLLGAGAGWSAMFAGADNGVTAVVGGLHRSAGDCFSSRRTQPTPRGSVTRCSSTWSTTAVREMRRSTR